MAKALVDHYEVLGLQHRRDTPTLSLAEVKKAYRAAALRYHPDKASTKSTSTLPREQNFTVDHVLLAYKTLSDPSLRAEYDKVFQSVGSGVHAPRVERPNHHTGLDTVDLDDFSFDEAQGRWQRDCRCGNDVGFAVTEEELEASLHARELVVGCQGCSLWLRVLFSVEDGDGVT